MMNDIEKILDIHQQCTDSITSTMHSNLETMKSMLTAYQILADGINHIIRVLHILVIGGLLFLVRYFWQ